MILDSIFVLCIRLSYSSFKFTFHTFSVGLSNIAIIQPLQQSRFLVRLFNSDPTFNNISYVINEYEKIVWIFKSIYLAGPAHMKLVLHNDINFFSIFTDCKMIANLFHSLTTGIFRSWYQRQRSNKEVRWIVAGRTSIP